MRLHRNGYCTACTSKEPSRASQSQRGRLPHGRKRGRRTGHIPGSRLQLSGRRNDRLIRIEAQSSAGLPAHAVPVVRTVPRDQAAQLFRGGRREFARRAVYVDDLELKLPSMPQLDPRRELGAVLLLIRPVGSSPRSKPCSAGSRAACTSVRTSVDDGFRPVAAMPKADLSGDNQAQRNIKPCFWCAAGVQTFAHCDVAVSLMKNRVSAHCEECAKGSRRATCARLPF